MQNALFWEKQKKNNNGRAFSRLNSYHRNVLCSWCLILSSFSVEKLFSSSIPYSNGLFYVLIVFGLWIHFCFIIFNKNNIRVEKNYMKNSNIFCDFHKCIFTIHSSNQDILKREEDMNEGYDDGGYVETNLWKILSAFCTYVKWCECSVSLLISLILSTCFDANLTPTVCIRNYFAYYKFHEINHWGPFYFYYILYFHYCKLQILWRVRKNTQGAAKNVCKNMSVKGKYVCINKTRLILMMKSCCI